jgi:hypothetical protein
MCTFWSALSWSLIPFLSGPPLLLPSSAAYTHCLEMAKEAAEGEAEELARQSKRARSRMDDGRWGGDDQLDPIFDDLFQLDWPSL